MDFTSNTSQCICSDISAEEYSNIYVMYNFVVVIICMPLVATFGVIGNIVNVIVFTRPRMVSHSGNIYLAALAVSDACVVVTGLVIFWMDSARAYVPQFADTPVVLVYTLPFALIAQTCSVYLIVVAAIDCFINAYHLQSLPWYCTPKCARSMVSAVIVLSALYNSLRFGQFFTRRCWPSNLEPNATVLPVSELDPAESMIEICPTELYYNIHVVYNVYLYMCVLTFAPFILLTILNTFIIRRQKYLQQRKFEKTIMRLSTMAGHINVQEETEPDDPRVLIMVVLLFLGCNTLALVINIIETFFEVSLLILHYLTDISNLLVMVNSAVNVVIYYWFSDDFQLLLRDLLHCLVPDVRPAMRRMSTRYRRAAHVNNSNDSAMPMNNGQVGSLSPGSDEPPMSPNLNGSMAKHINNRCRRSTCSRADPMEMSVTEKLLNNDANTIADTAAADMDASAFVSAHIKRDRVSGTSSTKIRFEQDSAAKVTKVEIVVCDV